MEVKQNQTSYHGIYLNLTAYLLFPWKYIRVFQWLSKSEFLSFVTKVNQNNGNETKSDLFTWDIFKSDTILLKHIKVF